MAIVGLELEQMGQVEMVLDYPAPKAKKKGACEQTHLCPFKGDVVCMRCGRHICAGHQRRYKEIPVPFCGSCQPNSHEAKRMMWAWEGEGGWWQYSKHRQTWSEWISGAPDWLKRIRRESPI